MDSFAYSLMNAEGLSFNEAYGLTNYAPLPFNDIFDCEWGD